MQNSLEDYFDQNYSYLLGSKILIALSGGMDSVVLTDLVTKKLNLENIAAAHVNFALRGVESDEDQRFVEDFCDKRSIKLFTKKAETEKYAKENALSIEMAARSIRYSWFDQLMAENSFEYLLVAHHLNDNVETVLLNLVRGTGISGLRGIKEKKGHILRPLIKFSKVELQGYADKNKLSWREDSSNQSDIYRRNKLRNQVIPLLEELNPNFVSGFNKTLEKLSQTEELQLQQIQKFTKNIFVNDRNGNTAIDIDKMISQTAYKLLFSEKIKEYGFDYADDILNSLHGESGKQFISKSHRIIKDRSKLIIEKIQDADNPSKYFVNSVEQYLSHPFKIEFQLSDRAEISQSENVANLDFDKLKFPMLIRKWEKGDVFYPIGLKGKKKLSKYFKDEKYSIVDKEKQWLLCSEDKIVWIIGKRIDERFKVTEKTKLTLIVKT